MSSVDSKMSETTESFGPFVLLGQLGTSEAHQVFLAASQQLKPEHQLCVIKRIEPEVAASPGFEPRFARAARRLIHLDHRNVAQVFDVGQVDDWFYLAQEYVSGCSLRELIKASRDKGEAIPLDLAVLILVDLLRGLYHALRQLGPDGSPLLLWHGAISARKVMISLQGEVKLIGLDREWRPRDCSDGGLEDPRMGPRGDLEATAKLLTDLLGDAVSSAANAKAARISPALVKIVGAALSPDPCERPRDVGVLLRPLRALLHKLNPRCGPPDLEALLQRMLPHELELVNAQESSRQEALSTIERERARAAVRYASRTLLLEKDASVQDRARGRVEAGADELIGQLPGTRYRILRPLGEGGMGAVYAAEHTDLEKVFAVKILHETGPERDDLVAKLRGEARAASKLGHPNIVAVTDFGETPDGRVFFVMEHLVGQSLADVLEEESKVDQERALRILIQVCQGLAAAHAKGIIHRDVKPENIFLVASPQGEQVKLLDFGVALYIEKQQKRSSYVEGTPSYMSPELIRGLPIDGRSDLYSVGVVAYEMLAGRRTFQASKVADLLKLHLQREPEPLRCVEGAEHVHPALEGVVMRALSKHADERPESAGAMAEELKNALDLLQVKQARESWGFESARVQREIEETWADAFAQVERSYARTRGRRRTLSSLVVAGLVVAVTLAAIFLRVQGPEREDGGQRGIAAVALMPVDASSPQGGHVDASVAANAEVPPRADAAPQVVSTDSGLAKQPDVGTVAAVVDAAAALPDGNAGARTPEDQTSAVKRYIRLGYEHLDRGQLFQAEVMFNKALAQDPSRHDALAGLGRVRFQKNDYVSAEVYARRALKRNPRSTRYQLDLGAAVFRQGHAPEAEEIFRQILRVQPDNRAARRYLEAATGRRP